MTKSPIREHEPQSACCPLQQSLPGTRRCRLTGSRTCFPRELHSCRAETARPGRSGVYCRIHSRSTADSGNGRASRATDRRQQYASRRAGKSHVDKRTFLRPSKLSGAEEREVRSTPWRISLRFPNRRDGFCHMCQQTAPRLLEKPSAGKEKYAKADESKRAPHLVEQVAEIEPRYRGAEGYDAQVYQSSAGLPDAPPDEKYAEGRNEAMRGETGFGTYPRAIGSAVVVVLGPCTGAPGQRNDKGDRREHRNDGSPWPKE